MEQANEDLSLPKATISKLIADYLPDGVKCSQEARDVIQDCLTEFIHLLTTQANDVCSKSTKKVILPQHITEALEQLGFGTFNQELESLLDEHKKEAKAKGERRKGGSIAGIADKMGGMTEEELAEKQAELFRQARQKFELRQLESEGNAPEDTKEQ
ncbi:hypothetical protein MIR68_012115 [Amoeboaphelidium protococcarum]|nr:hypothetical protein MIR68_012115 [Amoeboaphelidium protococcarum]